jgi:hypothetical protein
MKLAHKIIEEKLTKSSTQKKLGANEFSMGIVQVWAPLIAKV